MRKPIRRLHVLQCDVSHHTTPSSPRRRVGQRVFSERGLGVDAQEGHGEVDVVGVEAHLLERLCGVRALGDALEGVVVVGRGARPLAQARVRAAPEAGRGRAELAARAAAGGLERGGQVGDRLAPFLVARVDRPAAPVRLRQLAGVAVGLGAAEVDERGEVLAGAAAEGEKKGRA